MDKTGVQCKRCGSRINKQGYCTELTCPFSDHKQTCDKGWTGHSQKDPHPNDETAPIPCTCSHGPHSFYHK